VCSWYPGREPETAQELEITFRDDAGGNRVTLIHVGWERLDEQGTATRTNYDRYPGLDHNSNIATVSITVRPVNDAPRIVPIADQTIDEGDQRTIFVVAGDPEGDPITLSASRLPGFATFVDSGNGRGSLTLALGFDDEGVYPRVTVSASDGRWSSSAATHSRGCRSLTTSVRPKLSSGPSILRVPSQPPISGLPSMTSNFASGHQARYCSNVS